MLVRNVVGFEEQSDSCTGVLGARSLGSNPDSAEANNPPTIIDVSREAGVSPTTASFVLSNSTHSRRISTETRKRVVEAARRLGYRRNFIGAALQRGYTDTIVLLAVGWELASSHADVLVGLSRAAVARGLTLAVHVASDDDEAERLLGSFLTPKPYGVLILWDSAQMPLEHFCTLSANGVPVVDLLPSTTEGIPSVTIDRKYGFYLATQHLIGLGHRRIGLLLAQGRVKTNEHKLAGYMQALKEAGIGFDESRVQEVRGFQFDADYDADYEEVYSLLRDSPDTTAVICAGDGIALCAVAAAQDMGRQVPKDFSVVGLGDTSAAAHSRPSITSVGWLGTVIADEAVQVLLNSRGKPNYKAPAVTYTPAKLVVRDSTGPAPP